MNKKALLANYYLQIYCMFNHTSNRPEAFGYHYKNAQSLKSELNKLGII